MVTLPPYPSNNARKDLPPSQVANLNARISNTLLQILSLPDDQLAKSDPWEFLGSYAKVQAHEVLSALVFADDDGPVRVSNVEVDIKKRMLALAARLAAVPQTRLDLETLLDISIAYGSKNTSQVKNIFSSAIKSRPAIIDDIPSRVIPAFQKLFNAPEIGLHGLHKAARCLLSLLRVAPSDVLKHFTKEFVIELAKCYEIRLSSIASNYGGFDLVNFDKSGWETQWTRTKVDLLDSFHLISEKLLGSPNAEYVIDLVFALLDIQPSPTSSDPIPFLNRTLLADYQHAYSFSSLLTSALESTDDARIDLLEATLKLLDEDVAAGSVPKEGALKIILGAQHQGRTQVLDPKGKGKAAPPRAVEDDPSLDLGVSAVLELLPDHDPSYIKGLLSLLKYSGNHEAVIQDLLEGKAPKNVEAPSYDGDSPEFEFTKGRVNVHNEEDMDLSRVTFGKKKVEDEVFLQDRTYMSDVKANILRMAEPGSEGDSEFEFDVDETGKRIHTVGFEEDLDDLATVDATISVAGDGEGSEDDDSEGADEDEPATGPPKPSNEAILVSVYLSDKKVFDRDANTRRSDARAALKTRLGWGDEQIEGWKIMLERNPKKDQLLMKYEFAGNRSQPLLPASQARAKGTASGSGSGTAGDSRGRGGRGGPRGNAARGGRGRGRGRGGHRGEGGERDEARERVWKEKHKSQNRTRGHDRKMARGGGAIVQ